MSNQAKELLEEYASIRTMEEIIDIAINMPPELIPERTGRWKPEPDSELYYISDAGNVVHSADAAGWFIEWCYSQRNCFKTHKEGEEELQRKINIAEMRDWLEEKNDAWEPDWNDSNKDKHYFIYDQKTNVMGVRQATVIQDKPEWKYGRTECAMHQMVTEFGEEKIAEFIEA